MANDNKKINELVSGPDDDPTAELEVLSEAANADVAAERDAHTFDFENLNAELGGSDETIVSLKASFVPKKSAACNSISSNFVHDGPVSKRKSRSARR